MEKTITASQTLCLPHQCQLEVFKDILVQNGYNLHNGRGNTDDITLLRFLRAQKMDLDRAFEQFDTAQTWRKQYDIQNFYDNVDVEYYEETRKMYPQWTGRRDKNGCAIYIFPMRHLTIKRLDAYLKNISSCPTSREHMVDKPDITPRDLHFHALYENLQHFVFPFVSQLARPDMSIPISESTHIVDVSGVSIRQFWSIRKYLQEASATATAHYPETLGRVFIVGAPAFFKSIWDMISQWFDPVTRSKIFLLSSSDDESTLRSFIDPPNLPKAYGGELDWQWQDLPNLDGPAKELMDKLHQDTAEGQVFPKGPIIFERGCIRLLGTIDGMPRRDGYCPK